MQNLVQQFQSSDDIPVFLLTSQVGGLGLTLTKADRVVIVDPAWNPSTDDQSVDRAYRIGQTKDVVVSRSTAAQQTIHCSPKRLSYSVQRYELSLARRLSAQSPAKL